MTLVLPQQNSDCMAVCRVTVRVNQDTSWRTDRMQVNEVDGSASTIAAPNDPEFGELGGIVALFEPGELKQAGHDGLLS